MPVRMRPGGAAEAASEMGRATGDSMRAAGSASAAAVTDVGPRLGGEAFLGVAVLGGFGDAELFERVPPAAGRALAHPA